VPENAPNHFVMNIAPADAASVDAMIAEVAEHSSASFPMFRGRAIGANGVDAPTW
jgi:putative ABC transport system permease protein